MTSAASRACRIGSGQYVLRKVGAGDTAAVLALFAHVFGEMPPDGWHDWKYGANGLKGRAVGLWDECGSLVAHYAGFPRRLLWRSQPVDAIQIGDVMVAPEVRGLLTRRGPFYQVCAGFFGDLVGQGKPYAAAFGFPNERAMQLGVRLGLYHDVGTIGAYAWPADGGRLPFGWQVGEHDAGSPHLDRLVDSAWQRQSQDYRGCILGVRDAVHLRTRFLRRPGLRYHCLAVSRFGAGWSAVAVALPTASALRWLDFIGPGSALPAVVAALRRHAAHLGLSSVEAWASPAARADLLRCGAVEGGTAAHFALACASACAPGELAEHGWWLGGDTDFL